MAPTAVRELIPWPHTTKARVPGSWKCPAVRVKASQAVQRTPGNGRANEVNDNIEYVNVDSIDVDITTGRSHPPTSSRVVLRSVCTPSPRICVYLQRMYLQRMYLQRMYLNVKLVLGSSRIEL